MKLSDIFEVHDLKSAMGWWDETVKRAAKGNEARERFRKQQEEERKAKKKKKKGTK